MASTRRIQLTTLSPQSAPSTPSETNLSHGAQLVTHHTHTPERTLRIELVLFEPDDSRCAEFHYPQLTEGNGRGKALSKAPKEKDDEDEEFQHLVRTFQKKYDEAPKQRKDRVQDLVDMGFGYDDNDSFIDNSEAYDELVPASLTTKYGGFYINVGMLQFRPACEENLSDDLDECVKPKKRKLTEGEVKMSKKKKRKEDVCPVGGNRKRSMPAAGKKRKAQKQQQQPNLDGMLRKFHKQKLQELQMFNRKETPPPASNPTPSDQAESFSGDVVLEVSSSEDIYQAVSEHDGLLTAPQNQKSPTETSGAPLPAAEPPVLEPRPQECPQLAALIRKLEDAVGGVMPEQIERYNHHCRAHAEARAAKLEAIKEKRVGDGSDEDEDDPSGKRVFAPRKRFRWSEEIRAVLCEVVRLKMSSYTPGADESVQDYLRSFLEASVKTLWPRGWMQSRILLIESRRVHTHITGVVARKRSLNVLKAEKFKHHMDGQAVSSNRVQPGARLSDMVPVAEPPILPSVEGDVYFPPSLRLPCPPAVAATEGSCGDPALPTPSLSHLPSTAPATVTPPHALPFPGPCDARPVGHTEICTASSPASAASGMFHDKSVLPAAGSAAQTAQC